MPQGRHSPPGNHKENPRLTELLRHGSKEGWPSRRQKRTSALIQAMKPVDLTPGAGTKLLFSFLRCRLPFVRRYTLAPPQMTSQVGMPCVAREPTLQTFIFLLLLERGRGVPFARRLGLRGGNEAELSRNGGSGDKSCTYREHRSFSFLGSRLIVAQNNHQSAEPPRILLASQASLIPHFTSFAPLET